MTNFYFPKDTISTNDLLVVLFDSVTFEATIRDQNLSSPRTLLGRPRIPYITDDSHTDLDYFVRLFTAGNDASS